MSLLTTLFPATIDEDGCKAIIAHKYVPGIKSLTMPYLNYWWEIAVNFLPLDLAPNVVTLTAFVQGIVAFYVYMYFEPNFAGTYDSKILYLYQAFSLFIYQTLDAIDGKQARRTNTSSPLGQLFDHGCDALFCLPAMLTPACMVQCGSGVLSLAVIICGQWVFYALNWQARHTGQFDFGSFSVDEIQLMGMATYTITAFYGTAFWRETTLFGLHSYIILAFFLGSAVFYNVVKANLKVKWHYDAQKTQTNKVNKRFYRERFYELGNLLVFQVSIIAWNSLSVLQRYPTKFITVSALVFGHLVHRLIICDVTKMKSRKVQYILLPFIIVGVLSIYEAYFDQQWIANLSMKDPLVINCLLLYSLYVMLNYAIRCMLQISDILGIRIFVIKPPKKQ